MFEFLDENAEEKLLAGKNSYGYLKANFTRMGIPDPATDLRVPKDEFDEALTKALIRLTTALIKPVTFIAKPEVTFPGPSVRRAETAETGAGQCLVASGQWLEVRKWLAIKNTNREQNRKHAKGGVLGAAPLGRGVAEDAQAAVARGETSPHHYSLLIGA